MTEIWRKNHTRTIAHYSNLNSILSILKSRELHASRFDYLEDQAEIVYAKNILKNVIYDESHYRTVVARKALFLVRLMSFLCSQKSHKKDDMKHIKELQLLLSEYFNLSGHNLECLSFFCYWDVYGTNS